MKKIILTDREAATSPYQDKNVVLRIVMMGALTLGLLGAIRWASDITNANAKQVSGNLSQIRSSMDTATMLQPTNTESRKASRNKKRQEENSDAP